MRINPFCILFYFLVLSFIPFSLLAQKDENLLKTLKEHSDQVYSVAFNHDGSQFISGSKDETIKIWDFNTSELLNTLQKHHATIYELTYTHDGNYIISGGDNSIKRTEHILNR